MNVQNFFPSFKTIAFRSILAALCASLIGCTWHGVLKNSTDIGWGGRAVAVAVDPTNDDFVMAATPTGGVFDSALGGSAWGHIDALPEFGCFDIKFSPDHPNIIIVTIIGHDFYSLAARIVQYVASAALGQVQLKLFTDLRRHVIFKVVSKFSEEFLARDH